MQIIVEQYAIATFTNRVKQQPDETGVVCSARRLLRSCSREHSESWHQSLALLSTVNVTS